MGSKTLQEVMTMVEAATGSYMPRLVIDTIRDDLKDNKAMQVLADLIEGMADHIDELERNKALRVGRRTIRRK